MMKARVLLATAVLIGGAVFVGASPVAASTGARTTTPVCGPKTVTKHPAPGVGQQATYKVKRAGTVTLREQSTTSLEVTDADASSGWKDTVITKTGARVHVGFQQVGAPEEQERFWARLNTAGSPGTMITIVLQSCS